MACLSRSYQMLTLFNTVCKQQTHWCYSLSLLSRRTYPKCLSWPRVADPVQKTCMGSSLSALKLFSIRSSCYKNTQSPRTLFWMTCLLWERIRRQWEKWISKVNFMPTVEMFTSQLLLEQATSISSTFDVLPTPDWIYSNGDKADKLLFWIIFYI